IEIPDEEDNEEEMQHEVHEDEYMQEAQSEPEEEAEGHAQIPTFQNPFEVVSDENKLAELDFVPTNEEWWDNVIKATRM
ncbi:hypothetical protein A2U01_0023913, partial [Trifolium medium]|nr:hypothetical protein [Trifolium medium]